MQETIDELIFRIPNIKTSEKLQIKIETNLNKEIPEKTGIYFIFNNNNIPIYIGKAINILKRIKKHESNRNQKGSSPWFDEAESMSYKLFEETETNLELIEALYIYYFMPKYNYDIRISLKQKEKPIRCRSCGNIIWMPENKERELCQNEICQRYGQISTQ